MCPNLVSGVRVPTLVGLFADEGRSPTKSCYSNTVNLRHPQSTVLFRHSQSVYKQNSLTMQNELDVVRDVDQKLSQLGIGYMLTGSLAMNYYAEPRMTRDVDVVVAIGPNDVEQMASLFEPEYYLSKESMRESI